MFKKIKESINEWLSQKPSSTSSVESIEKTVMTSPPEISEKTEEVNISCEVRGLINLISDDKIKWISMEGANDQRFSTELDEGTVVFYLTDKYTSEIVKGEVVSKYTQSVSWYITKMMTDEEQNAILEAVHIRFPDNIVQKRLKKEKKEQDLKDKLKNLGCPENKS